jgi:hypothetical protein
MRWGPISRFWESDGPLSANASGDVQLRDYASNELGPGELLRIPSQVRPGSDSFTGSCLGRNGLWATEQWIVP